MLFFSFFLLEYKPTWADPYADGSGVGLVYSQSGQILITANPNPTQPVAIPKGRLARMHKSTPIYSKTHE